MHNVPLYYGHQIFLVGKLVNYIMLKILSKDKIRFICLSALRKDFGGFCSDLKAFMYLYFGFF